MYTLISVLIVIVCVLLIMIVLVQNSKGGGLASNFQASNQVMGVRKTADFLEKSTWTLAVALLVFSLLASMTIPRNREGMNESRIQQQIENTVDPGGIPNFPTTIPESEPVQETPPEE